MLICSLVPAYLLSTRCYSAHLPIPTSRVPAVPYLPRYYSRVPPHLNVPLEYLQLLCPPPYLTTVPTLSSLTATTTIEVMVLPPALYVYVPNLTRKLAANPDFRSSVHC